MAWIRYVCVCVCVSVCAPLCVLWLFPLSFVLIKLLPLSRSLNLSSSDTYDTEMLDVLVALRSLNAVTRVTLNGSDCELSASVCEREYGADFEEDVG